MSDLHPQHRGNHAGLRGGGSSGRGIVGGGGMGMGRGTFGGGGGGGGLLFDDGDDAEMSTEDAMLSEGRARRQQGLPALAFRALVSFLSSAGGNRIPCSTLVLQGSLDEVKPAKW